MHAILHRAIRDRALLVALVVGTILFAINQLDVVVSGGLTAAVLAKIFLTYAVPYSVSTFSSLQANRIG